MSGVLFLELLVHTWTLQEGCIGSFIDPFVDVDAALGAFQVARGFCQQVLARRRLVRLLGKERLDVLGAGWLLWQRCGVHGWLTLEIIK